MDIINKTKPSVTSLQVLCCKVISLNTELIVDPLIDDLNQPCLDLIVDYLSMYDLLRLENLLLKRGINVKSALYRFQRSLLMNNETYPIKSTTCPHLLDLFPCDGWDWGLSRLLYRRAIVQLIEEYNQGSNLPLGHLVEAHSYLLDLFCPLNTDHRDTVQKRVMASEGMVEQLAVLAARYVLFITIDQKHCEFLLDKKYETLLDAFCSSLHVISVILKSSPLLLRLIRILKERAKKLERICLNVIRTNDLQYFDSVLSVCSGVVGYYSTGEGQRDRKRLMSVFRTCQDDDASVVFSESKTEQNLAEELDQTSLCFEADPDFDLMDDALLFGTSTSKFDSNAGMTKADFKFTNLVDKDMYVPVLDHHLRSWLSLRELHLGVPELPPKIVQGLCSLLQRPHFKSFTLSSTDFNHFIMEDILCAVANRGCNPLDKLMFVSLQERVDDIADLLPNDHLSGKSHEEVERFVKHEESARIAEKGEFQGTKLLELYLCTLGVKTECILVGFVSNDVALTNLCFSSSVSRLFVQHHLRLLHLKNRQMTTLILEDWQVLNPFSCYALTSLMSSAATSLQSLSLKGCLHMSDINALADILVPISSCRNLICLDLSENHLGDDGLQYLNKIISDTGVREIAVRKNGFSVRGVLCFLQQIQRPRSQSLEILDLRGNKFVDCHRVQYQELTLTVAKFLLVDHVPDSVDNS